jgi:hypothetical protein
MIKTRNAYQILVGITVAKLRFCISQMREITMNFIEKIFPNLGTKWGLLRNVTNGSKLNVMRCLNCRVL